MILAMASGWLIGQDHRQLARRGRQCAVRSRPPPITPGVARLCSGHWRGESKHFRVEVFFCWLGRDRLVRFDSGSAHHLRNQPSLLGTIPTLPAQSPGLNHGRAKGPDRYAIDRARRPAETGQQLGDQRFALGFGGKLEHAASALCANHSGASVLRYCCVSSHHRNLVAAGSSDNRLCNPNVYDLFQRLQSITNVCRVHVAPNAVPGICGRMGCC